jgi:hypothetical protein
MVLSEVDFDMQPLSRVRPDAPIRMNDTTIAMTTRPKVAVKIAECIAEFAEVEFTLAGALGAALGSNSKIALAMYTNATSRNSQLSMLQSAVEASVPTENLEVFAVIMKKVVMPAMKDRDKLAHWCWAHSSELPDDLLLIEPTNKTMNVGSYLLTRKAETPLDRTRVYVLTEADLQRTFDRIRRAKLIVGGFISTIYDQNSDEERAQYLQQLKAEPEVQEALLQLRERQKNNLAAQPPSPRPDQSGGS